MMCPEIDLERIDAEAAGASVAGNLLDGIEKSRATPFESVLFAIGIRYVGKTVAEKLARYFKSIDNIG
jgi:DNA ligase (NAD+)